MLRPLYCCIALAIAGGSVRADVITFTSESDWFRVVEQLPNVYIGTETFANNQFQLPEVALTTHSGMGSVSEAGNGSIVNGAWSDCVGKNACNELAYDTTTVSASKPLFAFGGTWNMPAAYPGGLEIYVGDSPVAFSPNQIQSGRYEDGTAFRGFFGIVSSEAFSTVTLGSSYGYQSFTLFDMVLGIDPPPVATAPEPALLAPFGLGALLLLMRRKRA